MIRILEKDNNRRGDLFGRLMADLFVALGYEQPRLNVHKSGRELDLTADHRLEPRRAIGECKATAQPIGGDDLNKFVGVLDVEREDKHPVTGYFISLAGFRETAIEQERQRHHTKIVTLTGPQVVSELVKGRALISKEQATELAGRCCSTHDHLALDTDAEILAHERGWIWAVHYTQGKLRTHFALIHSDGTLLARALADEIIAADQACGGKLYQLFCLNPEPSPVGSSESRVEAALAAYRQYLLSECGFIQLDGLPADSDVGSRRLRLENLFVPLHLDVTMKVREEVRKRERQQLGPVLAEHPRLALLAAPGGGKSTLLKRLAVAYVEPARRSQAEDSLPERDWLPLFFRCRELRGMARGSFAELLDALSQREPVRQYAVAFRAYVDRELLAGRVMLLVDGLDEISDPGDRAAFVCTLRSVLQAYSGIALVVTSREAGFRHVAAHLAPVCTRASLSVFNAEDISRLSVAWHREVVGDSEKVRTDAEELASTISGNDRIQRLAINPLLLTTLLLVKRWVGSLPTRRAVLYGKAVEVLLMTWNTEGHDPIPEEEALPQLCYVASAMMLDGVQKISRPKLTSLIQEARDALPTELGYVKGTVDEFIHRVEDRSSLLMMTGYDVEDGRLVEFFEFRHLTFQEFLAAQAMVKGWHPGRKEEDTLVSVLDPHCAKEQWREVIPLAAALGGKAAEALIQRLTARVGGGESTFPSGTLFVVLGCCLADEAAARPETIRAAVHELVRKGSALEHELFTPALIQGKYGAELRSEARVQFLSGASVDTAAALALTVWWQAMAVDEKYAVVTFLNLLRSSEDICRCEGALGLAFLGYNVFMKERQRNLFSLLSNDDLQYAGSHLVAMLFERSQAQWLAGSFGLMYLAGFRVWSPPDSSAVSARLFELWREAGTAAERSFAATALAALPLAPRDSGLCGANVSMEEVGHMLEGYENKEPGVRAALLVVSWYLHALHESEIAERARPLISMINVDISTRTLEDLLVACTQGDLITEEAD
jgi:hypothetical protein